MVKTQKTSSPPEEALLTGRKGTFASATHSPVAIQLGKIDSRSKADTENTDCHNCHNPKALKFITRLRLGLSHLRYHKFKHNFQDSLNPLCNCGLITETTSHYLLHCPLFADERKTFLSNIKSINHKFLEQNDSTLTQTLLFGDPASSVETNTPILNAKIQYVLSTERFEEALL